MKTYVVSEELLRQVLGALGVANGFALDNNCDGAFDDEINALSTLLAKEPSEPVAWKDTNYGNLHHQTFDRLNDIPLYLKDTP